VDPTGSGRLAGSGRLPDALYRTPEAPRARGPGLIAELRAVTLPVKEYRARRRAMDHVHAEHIAAAPDRVFAALAAPDNLTRFVPQLTKVNPHSGDRVEVEARYEGRSQHGDAYFRSDESARTIEWGTDGGYNGSMTVEPDGDGSMLTLSLHTTHLEHADHDIAATLDSIRRLVEADI
jgi:Polyketide cyclase / dehydrase and lipid transport